MDAKLDREKVEYERNERCDEVDRLKHERDALLQETEELQRSHQSLLAQSGAAADGSPRADAVRHECAGPGHEAPGHPRPAGLGPGEHREAELEERQREADRPLRRKVDRLDKNLEQLTLMYHKLVAQNSGLKVELFENDKKVQRKDQRISQLERNLREAKQKYEKLLTQCANLTAAMDVMGRAKAVGGFPGGGGGGGGSQVRRSNIVRPVRGGIQRYDAPEVFPGAPVLPPESPVADSPPPARRDGSRTRLGQSSVSDRGFGVP